MKSLTFSNLMAFWLYRSTRVNGKTNCTINQMLMSLTFNNATGSQQFTKSKSTLVIFYYFVFSRKMNYVKKQDE